MRRFLLTSVLLVGTSVTASPEVIRLTATRDNTLIESPDGSLSNGAGSGVFAGNNGQGVGRRALLFFDLRQIPAGTVIDSVTLTLQVSNAPNAVERLFTLHRVLAPWGEGTSVASGGGGDASTQGDATWIHSAYPFQFWRTPGGDFDPTASAEVVVADLGTPIWSGAGMVADVRSWVANPDSNYGWLLRGDEIELNTARRFDSRESNDPTTVPLLTIHSTTAMAQRSTTWGSIKHRYR